MKTTHPAFWGAAWAGLAVGGALTVFGLTSLSDVASLAGGYGLMLMGTALFLLAGLKLRERLMERAETRRVRRIALARLPQRAAPATTFGDHPAAATAPASSTSRAA
jgi:hypothetical protein